MTVAAEDRPKKMKTKKSSKNGGPAVKKAKFVEKTVEAEKKVKTNVEKVKKLKQKLIDDSPKAAKKLKQSDDPPKKTKKQKLLKEKAVEPENEVSNVEKVSKKQKQSDDSPTKKQKQSDDSPKSKKQKPLKEKIENKKSDLKEKIQNKGKKPEDEDEEKDPKTEAEKKAEMRGKQKKLREERRKKDQGDGVFDVSVRAKQVWEELRRKDCPEEKKKELLKELHDLVKGQVIKLIYAHDTVRVIECLVAQGNESIREALFDELKDDLIALSKSRYSSFFVQNMVKYGTKKQREAVFKAIEGRVSDLTKHKIANTLVEMCYNDFSTAPVRNRFLQEFFGPEFRHFKEEDARTVIELMERHPEKRRDILKHLASHVNALVTKGCYNHSLVHTVLYNYMIGLNYQIENTPAEKERREKERTEFINSLRDVCVHIVHSHDGARLTMNAIWHGTAKDRKAIIKSFKTFMIKVSKEEHGYMALIAILDAVDDTKLTGKAVFGELTANDEVLEGIIANSHSRKVLTFAMVGRSKTYFHPDVLANLGKGDGNSGSKKDAETRRSELADALATPLFSYINKNLDHFLATNPLVIFLGGALLNAPKGNLEAIELFKTIAEKVTQPFVPGDGSNLMENPAIHTFVKKILGKEDFYKLIMDNMEPETLNSTVECQRGAFLFVAITKLENPEAKKMVKSALKNHMSTLKKQSKLTNNKGATILLEILE
jgi:pumilio family protein 6